MEPEERQGRWTSQNTASSSGIDVKDLDKNEKIFSEPELRRISKSCASLFRKNDVQADVDFPRRLESTLGELLHTAEHDRLSSTHRVASCNALCGFIEQGIASDIPLLRAMFFTSDVWTRILGIFIERPEDTKAKPMKQVLLTMTKLLFRNPNAQVIGSLRAFALDKAISIIYSSNETLQVKYAMQALEHFMNHNVLSAFAFLYRSVHTAEIVNAALDGSSASMATSSRSSPADKSAFVLTIQRLVLVTLQRVGYPDVAPAIGRFLASFFRSLQNQTVTDASEFECISPMLFWIDPLKEAMMHNLALLEVFELHVLPDLLRLSSSDVTSFLKTLPLRDLEQGKVGTVSLVDIHLCMLTMKISEEQRIPIIFEDMGSEDAELRMSDKDDVLINLLAHKSSSIRNVALSLLAYSSSLTKPFSAKVLASLMDNVSCFHSEVDPKTRNEFISLAKRACTRLNAAIMRLRKSLRDPKGYSHLPDMNRPYVQALSLAIQEEETEQGLLRANMRFVDCYVEFLIGELRPTASYQRHITALKVIEFNLSLEVFASVLWSTLEERLRRLLLDLAIDPFEDVRQTTVSILAGFSRLCQLPVTGLGDTKTALVSNGNLDKTSAARKAELWMRRTGRADHADGAGLLYSHLYDSLSGYGRDETRNEVVERLLGRLELDVKTAEDSLRLAVLTAPLHGWLIALRYIITRPNFYKSLPEGNVATSRSWRNFHDRLFSSCSKIWEVVKDTLCNDSPEGHVPFDTEEDELDIGVKDTLSFCWRALKETSTLIHVMITNHTYGPPSPEGGLQYEDFRKLGGFTLTQLAELRHRGAFSTVSQTFSACCTRCLQTKDPEIVRLPKTWYQVALSCLQEKASALTRRSAGFPAMITGVLSAYLTGNFFDQVIQDLQAIAIAPIEKKPASNEIRLPQVHALNCLKDVFTNTRLGPGSELHISYSLDIAAACLEKDVWAIQNCGLMLLRALLTRLIGGTGSPSRKGCGTRRFSPIVYTRYPNLSHLVVQLLQSPSRSGTSDESSDMQVGLSSDPPPVQRVFPALEIIERGGLPPKHQALIRSLIDSQLESCVWYIREKAAKTISLVVQPQDCAREVDSLLRHPFSSQNALHGRLLCAIFIVHEMRSRHSDDLNALVPSLIMSFDTMVAHNRCPFTVLAYLEVTALVLDTILEKTSRLGNQHIDRLEQNLRCAWEKVKSQGDKKSSSSGTPAWDLRAKALVQSLIALSIMKDVPLGENHMLPSLLADLLEIKPSLLIPILEAMGDSAGYYRCGDVLSSFYIELVKNSVDVETKAIAVTRFADLLTLSLNSNSKHDTGQWQTYSDLFHFLQTTVDKLMPNPQLSDALLQSQGVYLALESQDGLQEPATRCRIAMWVSSIKLAGNERNEISSRLAAAKSLDGFRTGLRQYHSKAITPPAFLDVYLAIYDLLSDDDEEIRNLGSLTVSWVLSAPDVSTCPSEPNLSLSTHAARVELLRFIAAEYFDSKVLYTEAVGRMIGIALRDMTYLTTQSADENSLSEKLDSEGVALLLPTVDERLREACKEDTILFAEEKHNLFADEVSEAERWSEVVLLLSDNFANFNLGRKLAFWTTEGVAILSQTAQKEVDGPLGWSSKPEVFTLGMRVLLAARVVISLANRGIAMPMGIDTATIRHQLQTFVVIGKKSKLHGFWVRRIEEMLAFCERGC